jgi:hypothetical protein
MESTFSDPETAGAASDPPPDPSFARTRAGETHITSIIMNKKINVFLIALQAMRLLLRNI